MELRLRLTYDALTALIGSHELVFRVPDSAYTISLALDDDASHQIHERMTAWMLANVPTEGGRH